jgi:lipoprotein-releasing system ATP-binding protein
MADGSVLVRAEGIFKTYGERVVTPILRGIDLDLEAGEICALTGPSCSGKTTFLNLVGLLDRPKRGRILIGGEDTGHLTDEAQTFLRGRTLGFVFQFHHLLSALTALENVMMPLLAQRGRREAWMREKATGLLESVDLAHRADYR